LAGNGVLGSIGYRADRPLEILENPRQLSGEAVLPGFVVDLQKLWG
jgi:hypothetical protein